MTHVIGVLARVEVDSIDDALPTYEALTGGASVARFSFGDIDLAWVGSFLLLSGPADALAAARRSATILVDDIASARDIVLDAGGEVVEPPADAPNGPRMIARHADGAVFEYIEPRRGETSES